MHKNKKRAVWGSLIAAIALQGSASAVQAAVSPVVSPAGVPPIESAATAISGDTTPTHALTAADVNAWLDGFLPNALNAGDLAGAVVVVVKDGQVLFEKGYGYSDYAKRTPVDPKSTLFRWGSTSKLFTWTAVMQLVEQGKIDLDADV